MEKKGDKKPGDLSWGKFYRVFQGDCRFIEHTRAAREAGSWRAVC